MTLPIKASKLIPWFALLALLPVAAGPTAAQSIVMGQVVDDETEQAIVTVDIRLIDANGVTRVRGLSDNRGNFRMEVPDSGTYQLSARRVGYAPVLADSIWIAEQDQLELMIRLSPSAVALQAVTVVAQRSAVPLRITQFRERADLNQRMGVGRIYMREDLDRLRPNSPQEILDGVIWTARCAPEVLLDGLPVDGRITSLAYDEVEGIEIYRGINQIPQEYYRYGMCGLAMVWTRTDPPGMRPFSWWRAAVGAGLLALIGLLMR
jgi:hypothetical protein